ncbi:EAL domain-containing protein [Clostridium transplantifaecale]|uniref:EAL domain-containing protein n=1 Tax=Clostridium transplantifaecale TaxID=2479838 RepID=UPI000F62E941|nr:EAL domain-containing protein [Clostridium transplantifaecale]
MGRISNKEDAGIYIIDDQYQIVYFNDKIRQTFPRLSCGEKCYRAMCREDEPCRDCPAAREEAKSGVLYNKVTQRWVEVSGGNIDWPGYGPCTMVMTTGIREVNKNLFYNLTSISAYDELFELNLTRDTYKILYHQSGKYVIPAEEGALKRMMEEVVDGMIHPDDREGFLEFWDLDRMFDTLQEEGADRILKKQLRKLRTDGSYCWVAQIVVPLNQGEYDDRILMCFIQDIDEQKKKEFELSEKDRKDEERDSLTGLYHRSKFFREADRFLREIQHGPYCIMAIDVEHFKLFNQWYGEAEGDRFLINIGEQLKKAEDENHGLAGYMGGDDFVIILPDDKSVLLSLQDGIMGYVRQYGKNAGFLPAFGLYTIEDRDIPVSTMYDRAAVALASVKGNYAQRVCRFDSRMMKKMEENHRLLSEVQRALDNDEFVYYLQPQCNMTNGKIVGLETLVRWIHPVRGVISPGEFIPLLESNGLIASLDLHMWEKICINLRNWIDRGKRPVPVSVNVSRVDIYTIDVVECFVGLVEKYHLEPKLLEIEITESAYAEEYDIFTGVIAKLRAAGFLVFMDDFGSGYSSLNMLSDVKVDVLKIDMKFLKMDDKSEGRAMRILETIINMARFMELRMIAEGVETRAQMEMLLDMGCQYGQGYYFYRPMPIADCEAVMAGEENMDFRGITARTISRMQTRDLMNDDIFSETMLNNILGGIALYDSSDGHAELLRANEQYCKITGANLLELEEKRKNIEENIYREDRGLLIRIFEQAFEDRLKGGEGELRYLKGDGSIMWMHLRAFFMREQDGHRQFYCSVSDITRQKQKEYQLESSQRALAAVVNVAENDRAFMRLAEENRRAAAAIFAQMTPGGMIGGYCEEGFPLYFANSEMVQLLGYDSYEELEAAIGGLVLNTIHPEDREQVEKDIGPEYYAGLEYTTTYRMPKKDGTWFWTLDKGKVVMAEDGRLAIISACTDISETMSAQQQLAERNAALIRQNQELYFLNNDMPGGYHRCARTENFDFLYISNRFLEITGCTREEIRTRFDDKFINMVHPDDRSIVRKCVESLRRNEETYNLEYRIMAKQGYIWVADQSRYMEYGGKAFLQGVVLDITETVELRNRMKLLMKHLPESVSLLTYKDGDISVQILTNGLFGRMGCTREEYEEMLRNGICERAAGNGEEGGLMDHLRWSMRNRGNYQDIIRVAIPERGSVWMSLDVRYIDEGTEGMHFLCICADVSYIREKEQELWLTGTQMESVLRQAEINSWDWDIENNRLTLNRGTDKREAPGGFDAGRSKKVIEGFTQAVEGWEEIPAEYRRDFLEYLSRIYQNKSGESLKHEVPMREKDGSLRWIRVACETIRNGDGKPVKAVGYYVDITEEKKKNVENKADKKALELLRKQKLKLTRMAENDALTGLYNRQTAIPRIKEFLQNMDGETAALIMLDLDNFKLVNDVFGHAYGDSVIAGNAAKLKSFFRQDDIICRIGGDEFLVFCKNICEEVLENKITQVIDEMKTTYENGEQKMTFSVSAGYAMMPDQGKEFDELYQRADIALFAAKTGGRGTFRKYEASMKKIRYELAGRN